MKIGSIYGVNYYDSIFMYSLFVFHVHFNVLLTSNCFAAVYAAEPEKEANSS